MHRLFLSLATLALIACNSEPAATTQAETAAPQESQLAAVLDAQPEKVKARYQYRHPQETLEFFGIEPGMTVMEALPGGGWYSKILLPYLGKDGHLIGADYDLDMYAAFGFYDDESLEKKKSWISNWTTEAETWRNDSSASISAFVLGSMPDDMAGSADAVLFIRALHNLNNFEADGGYLTAALADA